MKFMVGIDSSDLSREVLDVACSLLKNPKVDILYLIHVWKPAITHSATNDFGPIASTKDLLEREGRHLLLYYGQKCAQKKLRYKCILARGDRGKEICNMVKKHQIGVLVLGNRKLGAFEKFFLNTLSEYCLKHAECSVMIHKEGAQVHPSGLSSPPHPVSGKELLLGNLTLSECLGKRKHFIHVELTTDAHHIIKALTGNSITAVPVFDTAQNKWLGFVDMMDIADYLIQFLKEAKTEEQPGSLLARKPLLDIQAHQLFRRESRSKIFRSLSTEDHLKHALELILEGYERIAVQDQDGKFVGVLSETKIVSFLSSSVDLFDLSQKTVEELQLGYREVITVNQHEPLKVAIEIILEKNVHGVGVMEGDKIIGNLSVSDLKMAESDEELLQMFLMPVREILALQKRAMVPFPICVLPQTTVEEVIEKFALTRVHRVYVVSEKGQLVGVITMRDLMSLIFSTFISS